jgi:hypothetical protein
MAERQRLLSSIAETIADYREGEIALRNPGHVQRWVEQFDCGVRDALLEEMDHVLRRSYISRRGTLASLERLVERIRWLGRHRPDALRSLDFLKIQKHGTSQRDLLQLLDEAWLEQYGFGMADCHSKNREFVYLDDVLFTGARLISDVEEWLAASDLSDATLHLVFLAVYSDGKYYATRRIGEMARQRNIRLRWWTGQIIENRKRYAAASQVLWPSRLPDDPLVAKYVAELENAGYGVVLRKPDASPKGSVFSSASGRDLLEQHFLIHGVRIRSLCKKPAPVMRPLGFCKLRKFGFGSMIVTYRNCPNNSPLVLWYGNPNLPRSHPLSRWWPLFPRRREEEPDSCDESEAAVDSREDRKEDLFESLKRLRRQIAADKHIPAFVVFHDSTLRDMARHLPTTPEAFLQVRGVGPKKSSQYGAAFISEIERFCKSRITETDIARFTQDPSGPRPTKRGR